MQLNDPKPHSPITDSGAFVRYAGPTVACCISRIDSYFTRPPTGRFHRGWLHAGQFAICGDSLSLNSTIATRRQWGHLTEVPNALISYSGPNLDRARVPHSLFDGFTASQKPGHRRTTQFHYLQTELDKTSCRSARRLQIQSRLVGLDVRCSL